MLINWYRQLLFQWMDFDIYLMFMMVFKDLDKINLLDNVSQVIIFSLE